MKYKITLTFNIEAPDKEEAVMIMLRGIINGKLEPYVEEDLNNGTLHSRTSRPRKADNQQKDGQADDNLPGKVSRRSKLDGPVQ